MPKQKDKSFYNIERKEYFMSEWNKSEKSKSTSVKYNRIFNTLGRFEEKYDKDFTRFNDEEVQDFLDNYVLQLSAQEIRVVISTCRNYLRFMIIGGFEDPQIVNENPIMVRDIDDFIGERKNTKYLKSYAKDIEDFKMYVKAYFSEKCYEMTAAAACLCWMQFSNKEINMMLRSDFDPEKRTICGKKIKDKFFYECIYNAYASNGYVLPKKQIYVDSPNLIRPVKGNGIPQVEARTEDSAIVYSISRMKDLEDKIAEDRISKERPDGHSLQSRRLTPATIRASSYFYECYLYEQKYGEDKMKNKYFDAIIIDRHQNNKNRFSDYQCWKSAFGL